MDTAGLIIAGIVIGAVAAILIKRGKCCAMKKDGDKKDGSDQNCCGHKH